MRFSSAILATSNPSSTGFKAGYQISRHSLIRILLKHTMLVELSELDSKKYKAILKFKYQINDYSSEHILSENPSYSNKQIDIYGEKVVKQLTQVRREYSAEEIQEMASLYQAGKTTRELGEKFGCSKTTISKLLKQQRVIVTKRKAQTKLDVEKMIAMYEEMYTSEQIARQFDVNYQTIIKCLREHGVKIRNRWDYPQ